MNPSELGFWLDWYDAFDAALYLGICDKIVPGLLIGALAFGHLPALFVPAGPMPAGIPNKKKAEVRERYAAGDYPTLSEPGQGLPAWTKEKRAIEKTDVVLWHTIGMHHVVRGEDWPVMPVMWHSFELRPFDFFDRNPALDLPKR